MVRASSLPDGITAPIGSGFSIHERMKLHLIVETKGLLFNARADDCKGICYQAGHAYCAAVVRKRYKGYRSQAGGQVGYVIAAWFAEPPKKVLDLE